MKTASHESGDKLSLSSRLQLNQICDDFERAWRDGNAPALGPFLCNVAESERSTYLRELILLDLDHRRARGLACQSKDYLVLFTELDKNWLDGVLTERQGNAEATRSFVAFPRTTEDTPPNHASIQSIAQPPDRTPHKMILGDYELKEEIGRGGMGVVYRAWHRSLRRWEAVKTGSWESPPMQTESGLLPDAEAMARLDHPNIVPVYSVGLEAGKSYLTMKLLTGGSLKDLLANGPLAPRAAAELIVALAKATEHAHERGVLHLDLKPSNILFDEGGHPYVADFGLAKLFQVGEAERSASRTAGTPSYMAPEQTAPGLVGALTPRTDIYGLGAVLYAVLAGRPPFQADNVMATLRQVVEADPVPPNWVNPAVDRDLAAICMKCLEKNPANRYATAAELAEDLTCYLRGEPSLHARRIGLVARFGRSLLRHQFTDVRPWGWLVLIVGFVGTLTYLGYAWAIYTQKALPTFLLIGSVNLAFLAPIYWYWVLRRWRMLESGDRFALTMTAGKVMALILIPIVLRPEPGDDLTTYRLSLFPIFSLLFGLALLAFSIHWNGYILFALGFFLNALLMRLAPTWAPIQFVVMFAASHAALGIILLRFAKSMEEQERMSL